MAEIKTSQASNTGIIVPILGIAAIGLGAWKLFDYLEAERSRRAIDDATKSKIKSELDTIRTKEAINKIETRAYVTGLNGYNKQVTVNIVNQAKELINGFLQEYIQNDISKYSLKAKKNINQAAILDAIFKTPLNNLRKLAVIYNIYTKRDLLKDCQNLDLNSYTKIKTLYKVAYSKYPDTFK